MDEWQNMFSELPSLFQESALVDRIHGFIKGWDIPRMNDDLKLSGWALNSEYFCTILHELRNDVSYRAIVDQIVDVPDKADTRDTEAVKRIATAYLKLLFPNVRSAQDINPLSLIHIFLALQNGMDAREVSQMLGHFRTSMTRKNYAPYLTCPAAKSENNPNEASQEELRQAADILDNLLKF